MHASMHVHLCHDLAPHKGLPDPMWLRSDEFNVRRYYFRCGTGSYRLEFDGLYDIPDKMVNLEKPGHRHIVEVDAR